MTPLLHGIVIGFAACIVCALLHIAALRIFPRWNLLDFPERYGLTRARLPYPTGILAITTFTGFLLTFGTIDAKMIGLLASIGVLAITAFIDDRYQLPSWLRIVIQIAVCMTVFVSGSRIYTITSPLAALGMDGVIKLDTIDIPSPFGPLPLLSGVFTIMWLGLTMNALNWFDGIPGQVSSISTIGFTMLGLLAFSPRVHQPELALIAFILAGTALACLLFDFPPPRVLMGDTGAMFFGLMLGVLGIYQGGKVATAFLALGIPLVDAFFVIARRILRKSSPLKGDRDHLHHRLLARGWSARSIVILIATIGSAFGITALFMTTVEKGIALLVLFILMGGLTLISKSSLKA